MPRDEGSSVTGVGAGVRAAFAALVVVSASCATSRRVVASLTANCREIEVGVAHEMMRDNPGILLLDVREKNERAEPDPEAPLE